MAILSQYYQVLLQDVDVTHDIDSIEISEEDGAFTVCNLSFTNGFLWLETVGKGNSINIFGGTSKNNSSLLFVGYVNIINPDFDMDGDVTLNVECFPYGHLNAGIQKETSLFPMENSPKDWAQGSPLQYSYIIQKIAEDNGYKIGLISVGKGNDKKATYKAPLAQKSMTTWGFLSDIAKKIKCVIWEEWKDGSPTFYCSDEEKLVNTISTSSFYYVARKGLKFSVEQADKTMLRLYTLNLNIDTQTGKAHNKLNVKTDPETGKDKVTTDTYDATKNEWTNWVFQEELLEKEPSAVRDKVFEIVTSSQSNLDKWEVIKKYFVVSDTAENPSQDPVPKKFEVSSPVTVTTDKKTFSPKKQYATTPALNSIPPEEQAGLLKRATAGNLTDEDFSKYFKEVDSSETNLPEKDKEKEKDVTSGGGNKKKQLTRRDEGFSINATAIGNNKIKTKLSYLVEGIGKYSAVYYLYKITRTFGSSGYEMTLTFTK